MAYKMRIGNYIGKMLIAVAAVMAGVICPYVAEALEQPIKKFSFDASNVIFTNGAAAPLAPVVPLRVADIWGGPRDSLLKPIPGVADFRTVFKYDGIMDRLIRRSVTGGRKTYLFRADEPRDAIQPATLMTLLFGSEPQRIVGVFEGKRLQFLKYSYMERGFTNLVSLSNIVYYSDNGKYNEYFTPGGTVLDLHRPTEDEMKKLKMNVIFMFLFDRRLNGKINF